MSFRRRLQLVTDGADVPRRGQVQMALVAAVTEPHLPEYTCDSWNMCAQSERRHNRD